MKQVNGIIVMLEVSTYVKWMSAWTTTHLTALCPRPPWVSWYRKKHSLTQSFLCMYYSISVINFPFIYYGPLHPPYLVAMSNSLLSTCSDKMVGWHRVMCH